MPRREANPVLEALRLILERHARYSGRLNVPGDWGERSFRGWLAMDLLEKVLGWHPSQIVFGEQFDLLLVDGDIRPLINIETKKPGHSPSRAELGQFKKRLPTYGTLQHAFLTNGESWTGLQLSAPRGRQMVVSEQKISLRRSATSQIEKFFDPLWSHHYLKPGQ